MLSALLKTSCPPHLKMSSFITHLFGNSQKFVLWSFQIHQNANMASAGTERTRPRPTSLYTKLPAAVQLPWEQLSYPMILQLWGEFQECRLFLYVESHIEGGTYFIHIVRRTYCTSAKNWILFWGHIQGARGGSCLVELVSYQDTFWKTTGSCWKIYLDVVMTTEKSDKNLWCPVDGRELLHSDFWRTRLSQSFWSKVVFFFFWL